MVSPIAPGNTNQWDVMNWVWDQGPYLPSAKHVAVLAYLASKAFYEENNPEGAEIGQVMRKYSYVEEIMAATGIRSRTTIRLVLNELQDMAYIQREERPEKVYGQKPHVIYVLWDLEDLRAGMRAGKKTLPNALKVRPTAPPRRPRPTLEVVQLPVDINS
jgi:hypothetical protein